MANAFLQKIEKAREDGLYTGIEIGFQMAADFISLAANDPDVIGEENALSEDKIVKILAGAKYYQAKFPLAFCTDAESDYQRDVLDRLPKDVFPSSFAPFEERYPRIREIKYGRKK